MRTRVALPAQLRLTRLAHFTPADEITLAYAMSQARIVRARRELQSDGRPITEPQLIVDGWAARIRLMPDGRRQIMSFLLPGDLIGLCHQPAPVAISTVIALTEITVCTPPSPCESPTFAEAYATSEALDEAYLLAHITRLGQMAARERILDLLLELDERLELAGLSQHGRFRVPLTQELLGDTLGLTSVHINRMLQQARQMGDLTWKGDRVELHDRPALMAAVGRVRPRVRADMQI
ncbi:MAG: Crp/Fnr family transcriptional regulator [Sphingomonas taxi]